VESAPGNHEQQTDQRENKTGDVRISTDGRERWLDNVFAQGVWHSLKYEEVHLKAYHNGLQVHCNRAVVSPL
jgi:hypothetical protein